MRCPTAETLQRAFKLTAEQAKLIRRLAKADDDEDALEEIIRQYCPRTQKQVNQNFSDPFRYQDRRTMWVLRAIDEVLDTCGVEPIGPISQHDGAPYEFMNTGDSYATTLVYKRDTDNLFISSYATIADRHPNW